jgi:hypothetical protein
MNGSPNRIDIIGREFFHKLLVFVEPEKMKSGRLPFDASSGVTVSASRRYDLIGLSGPIKYSSWLLPRRAIPMGG